MKSTLFLLAAMVGAVSGHELDVRLMGVTTFGEPCSDLQQEALYETCVVEVAVALGWDMSHEHRQLELRGSRELQTGSTCTACCDEVLGLPCADNGCWSCYPWGHWCWIYCDPDKSRRRLQVPDEHVHTERFLFNVGELQQKVNECFDHASTHGSPCLGNPEDITVKLYIRE
jgi:hypothetical protein